MEEENKNPLAPPEPETSDSPEVPEEARSENVDPDAPETPKETDVQKNDTLESPEPTPEPASKPAETPVSEEIQSADASSETPKILSAEPIPEPLSTEPKKKSRKPLIIVFIILLVLSLGVCAILFFMPEFVTNLFGKTEPQNSQETVEPEIPEASKLRLAGNSLSDFDLAFLKLENSKENKIYSPLSIKYALAMLKDGSAGETKTQIENLIGDYKPKAYLNSENRSLANALFVQDTFKDTILDSYIKNLKEKYYADVKIDAFKSASPFNNWVEDKTLGIIKNMFDDDIAGFDFVLINALAIDMNWNYQIKCLHDGLGVPCKYYDIKYSHEKYSDSVDDMDFDKITFNEKENVSSARIAASINRYDIIKELGEDYIRETVLKAYEDEVKEIANKYHNGNVEEVKAEDEYKLDMDKYIEELSANYGKTAESTDFLFSDSETERVFVKDLKEYDGSTLEYVGIMPKTETLENYVATLTAEKASALISSVKDTSIENFKDGVITKINGYIPFFKFDYDLKLMQDLKELGITDVFDSQKADLSNLTSAKGEYIEYAAHKADIEFSNNGIRAAAVTAAGGKGAGGQWDYRWDVPVEEIDLTFDKPFLFLIHDKATGEIWFTGTVYEI